MNENDESLIPYFIPSISKVLVAAEDKKGMPLEYDEVIAIRDGSSCIMMTSVDAKMMDVKRGYVDLDPENIWYEWQMLRRNMNRKPDLDTGPSFTQIKFNSQDYQQTVIIAKESIGKFKAMLNSDGTPRFNAMIKTKLSDGDSSAYIWLASVYLDGDVFCATLFEVPKSFKKLKVGQSCRVKEKDVVDWMVNDNGRLYGGYSLRLHRSRLSAEAMVSFDKHVGVTEYLPG